jgi:hypothetical protein
MESCPLESGLVVGVPLMQLVLLFFLVMFTIVIPS